MQSTPLVALTVGVFCLRLLSHRRFWQLPLKQGEAWFLTTPVAPGFYQGAGKRLLRQYRGWLLAPFALDGLTLPLLLLSGRAFYLLHVQVATQALTAVYYNLVFYQFAYRAKPFAAPSAEPPVTAAQLVMEPRRLRDHTNRLLEAAVLVGLTLSSALLGAWWRGSQEATPAFWGVLWLLYLQIGLWLLKLVFVRWRIKLPLRRTEDFRRWRAAWLVYHLRVFDAIRLLLAVLLVTLAVDQAFGESWQMDWMTILLALAVVIIAIYCAREGRRVTAVQLEVQPMTLAREFPPAPVAEGRFFASGLLYFNPDNPLALVRSPQGLAFNLAHRATCLWIVYLAGLILLLVWQISRASN
ncbi:MAG: hypothetical protein HYR56_17325 [Acidobacteria bacterium]|nr:hypothetical protein [Acidobacteriota bacterium]MBI3423830.1 hypothetical protein [Acidobacteriota bacterium]